MNLSPTVRWLLGGIAAGITAFGALLPTLTGAPTWLAVAVAVAGAVLAALGIVPPQVGGTQQGVVSPDVVDRPPSPSIRSGERGAADVAVLLIVVVAALAFLIGYLVEGAVVGLVAALAAALVTALVT